MVAAAMLAMGAQMDVKTGLDVLDAERYARLKGLRVGIVTNHTGLTRNGERGIDRMVSAGVNITALFSPEHGFAGTEDREGIKDAVDPVTKLPVFSLYGETKRPTDRMMATVDALVFDIADVGVRFYTYETTMAYCLEACAKTGKRFFVLDRPNPICGKIVEGPPLDESNVSFVGYLTGMPSRHGMTMGELARMYNAQRKLGAKLEVVPVENWNRGDFFDSTGLEWIHPSPNMRSLKAAILYPGVCLVEFPPNFSVGRGTDAPFEQVGADFVDAREFSAYLNNRKLRGIQFYPVRFTPAESRFKGVEVQGVRIEITDRARVVSTRLGIELACAIQKLYPGKIDWKRGRLLWGSNAAIEAIERGDSPEQIEASFRAPLEKFRRVRGKYLIYR